MARELTDVIDRMVSEIPVKESVLVVELQKIRASAEFAPPEGMRIWWVECAELLSDSLGDRLSEQWVQRVQAVFADKDAPSKGDQTHG